MSINIQIEVASENPKTIRTYNTELEFTRPKEKIFKQILMEKEVSDFLDKQKVKKVFKDKKGEVKLKFETKFNTQMPTGAKLLVYA